MRRLQYYIIVLGTSSALALTGCSTLPSNYVTAEGDACQAERADMKAVDDYFNQSLIQGTAFGAAAGGLAGALAGYLVRHDTTDLVIGATGGMVAGGLGGYFSARSQATQDRNALVQTIYDDATKENVQVNRATAAFVALKNCRLAAADAIKRSYRQGTLTGANAEMQLTRERTLFDQDIAVAERVGAQMLTRNTEFMNAATELDKTDMVASAATELDKTDMVASAQPSNGTPPAKAAPTRKSSAAKASTPPKPSARVMSVAVSNQDSVQAYNGNIQMAKAESGSKFNLAA